MKLFNLHILFDSQLQEMKQDSVLKERLYKQEIEHYLKELQDRDLRIAALEEKLAGIRKPMSKTRKRKKKNEQEAAQKE